jgi:hypothetical protein
MIPLSATECFVGRHSVASPQRFEAPPFFFVIKFDFFGDTCQQNLQIAYKYLNAHSYVSLLLTGGSMAGAAKVPFQFPLTLPAFKLLVSK